MQAQMQAAPPPMGLAAANAGGFLQKRLTACHHRGVAKAQSLAEDQRIASTGSLQSLYGVDHVQGCS